MAQLAEAAQIVLVAEIVVEIVAAAEVVVAVVEVMGLVVIVMASVTNDNAWLLS